MEPYSALVLFVIALPFCVWAIATDLREMKILNVCNLGLALAFVAVAVFLLPRDIYLLRLAQGALMLTLGIVLHFLGLMGGGDSKFLGAMAPYIALSDALSFLMLLSAIGLASVLLHRGAGRIPAVQNRFGHWKSFQESNKFPYGMALGSALAIYLALQLSGFFG